MCLEHDANIINICVTLRTHIKSLLQTRLEWETSVVKGAGMLESLEEERLAQLKSCADCYIRLTAAVPSKLTEVRVFM